MRKIFIATHGNMAKGTVDALDLLSGYSEIKDINCYREEIQSVDELNNLIDKIEIDFKEDEIIIFTDMIGGSVNNTLSNRLENNKNLHIVAGFNLPLILEFIFSPEDDTSRAIGIAIESAKNSIINVRKTIEQSHEDELEEEIL